MLVFSKMADRITGNFFRKETIVCFCSDVEGLKHEMGYAHNPEEWDFFLDSSKASLKAVLLHYSNKIPSISHQHML